MNLPPTNYCQLWTVCLGRSNSCRRGAVDGDADSVGVCLWTASPRMAIIAGGHGQCVGAMEAGGRRIVDRCELSIDAGYRTVQGDVVSAAAAAARNRERAVGYSKRDSEAAGTGVYIGNA